MADIKPMHRDSFDDYYIADTVAADTALLDHPGGMGKIQVVTAGHSASYIAVYNGTVAAGDRIGYLSGATIGATLDVDVWCGSNIHFAFVDSDATLVVRLSGYFR